MFCATSKPDSQMIDAFKLLWHDRAIKRIRATTRTLFFISPFIFMLAIVIHVFNNLGAGMAATLAVVRAGSAALRCMIVAVAAQALYTGLTTTYSGSASEAMWPSRCRYPSSTRCGASRRWRAPGLALAR